MSPSLATIGLVALCGGVGSVVRLLVATGVRNAAGEPYLLGTLVVNLIGCFLFGVAWGFASGNWSNAMQAAVFTGFFGGFTTFSSFSLQTLTLLREREWLYAGGNVLLSVALCLLATWLGYLLGTAFNSVRGS